MAITISDVARFAKVSTATVSRVMSGDKRISPATTERVQAAIDELGYTINHLAQSLKTNRSFTVGLICPEFTNDFYMGVAKGIEQVLKAAKISLMICNSNEDVNEEIERVNLLLEKCVDGIIIIPASNQGRHLAKIRAAKIPVVLVDRLVDDFSTDAVLVDNEAGSRAAVNHAFQAGFRRIGFIGGNKDLTSARERWEGYRQALLDHGLPLEHDLIRFGNFHTESGYQLMGELLALPEPPDLVFISNYYMHVGATQYITEHGPDLDQVPVIYSFDDMMLSFALGYCRLIVRQPTHQLGMTAADLLLTRIRTGMDGPSQVLRLATELIHKF